MKHHRWISAAALALSFGWASSLWAQDITIVDTPDFGDDTSQWANDGECDDPRFTGPGMTQTPLLDEDTRRDASDCRAAFEAGTITLNAGGGTDGGSNAAAAVAVDLSDIDFGDDSGFAPNDGECDDPRFEGPGVFDGADRGGVRTDAADCRAAVIAGTARYTGELAPPFTGVFDGIDFGDNSAGAAFDDECDDPRFEGPGVYSSANRRDVRADADDCRAAYEAGTATFAGELAPPFTGVFEDIDFGDNSATSALDNECDDPRFEGEGVFSEANRRDVRADADDCRSAYDAGTASYAGELPPAFTGIADGVDFGDNSSDFAFDEECDDRRFRGFGMTRPPFGADNEGADADDCHMLFADGFIRFIGEEMGFTGVHQGIDFGDNTSQYALDGECDDPRFRGPGMARTLLDQDTRRDAFDCRSLLDAGAILALDGVAYENGPAPAPYDPNADNSLRAASATDAADGAENGVADAVRDAVEETADAVEDTAEDAANAVETVVDDAADAVDDAVNGSENGAENGSENGAESP